MTTHLQKPRASTALPARFADVRASTEALAAPLAAEDQVVQSMPDASPVKWHLAHTTWFFETFLLVPYLEGYRPFHESFGHLFNSYYNAFGEPFARSRRGLITRPGVQEVAAYRTHVSAGMVELLEAALAANPEIVDRTELGVQHEQQHQELLLMDVKHLFSMNPLEPAYLRSEERERAPASALEWLPHAGGLVEIGHAGAGFAYDNEGPRHRVWLEPFRLASRPVTNGEFLEFVRDGGYARADLWLADGWHLLRERGWRAPLYWREDGGAWSEFTLGGRRVLEPGAPVCHVSFYEADAYARWAGARLPSEAEWEVFARERPIEGNNFLSQDRLHPRRAEAFGDLQLWGDVWEWTASAYRPYPGYQPAAGAVGEYNGKFMCNQMVLRGGSCLTPEGHVRATYRNFFFADQRWQMGGLRLAARD